MFASETTYYIKKEMRHRTNMREFLLRNFLVYVVVGDLSAIVVVPKEVSRQSVSCFMLYCSDSQPGVRVPLGVRKQIAGGTPNPNRNKDFKDSK